MMATHDEDLARLRAEMDQAREALRELGRSLKGFYDGLLESGFTDEQAVQLTQTFLGQSLATAPLHAMGEDFIKGLLRGDGEF